MKSEQQRRDLQRHGINSATLMTVVKAERIKAIKNTLHIVSVVTASVLHDKLDFGKKRLEGFMGKIANLYDSIEKGYVSIEDLEKTLKEETGVEFE